MAMFLIGAAVLLLLTLYAVLRPLLGRSKTLAAGIAFAVIAASTVLYLQLGTPAALDPAMVRAPTNLAEARAQLERKLAESPGDAEGWRLLGRAYAAEGNAKEAARAYAEAAKRAPRDADVLTEAAEARALTREDRRFDDIATAQLEQAIAIEPMHQRARWFLGISLRQAGEHAKAAEVWSPLLSRIDAKTAATLLVQINQARTEAGLAPMKLPTEATSTSGLAVQVTFAPGIDIQQLPDTARIFVIARAAGGPPMPVAVQKHEVNAMPLSIRLSDADSPMPTAKLSSLKQVEVIARLSMNGIANRQADDIESRPVQLSLPHTQAVELVIGNE